jgi:hypothetical protein
MSNQMTSRTLGFLEESIASEELITNNNSLMKIVKTMGTFSRQVSISSSLSLIGGSIADVMTITGGYIIIEAIFGVVVTVCSANACTLALGIDPTVGASDIPIGTAIEMNAAALGDTVWVEADASACVLMDQATNPALYPFYSFLCPAGGLDMDMSNSNLTTGAIDLIVVWRACSPEAYVTVA